MRLTKKKALEIAIELWIWLAESGSAYKKKWIGWKKYGDMQDDCPLCEYDAKHNHCQHNHCLSCPLEQTYMDGCYGAYFNEWDGAKTKRERKKYAALFLEQLKELK